jgi:hypothetical protein
MTGSYQSSVARFLLTVAFVFVTLSPDLALSSRLNTRYLCGLDANFECQRQHIPEIVKSVCNECGQMWADVGLSYCCRCDEHIFDSCYEAVFGV